MAGSRPNASKILVAFVGTAVETISMRYLATAAVMAAACLSWAFAAESREARRITLMGPLVMVVEWLW